MERKKLKKEFYLIEDVVEASKLLLGKKLCTFTDGLFTSGIITETEAYNGVFDKASHAYGGRHTPRTEVMYREGGVAYIYLCYGIFSLFNVVTNKKGIPNAVLVRAITPVDGIEIMQQRRKKLYKDNKFAGGPGTLSQALGLHYSQTGTSLRSSEIWIEETEIIPSKKEIISGPRIGVGYAGDDAKLPYRFIFKMD
ncbi:MAG: DNA-3-methyladenine glycosylase [Bacteroidia bacterium]